MSEPGFERRRRRWPQVVGGVVLLLGAAAAAGVFYLDSVLLKEVRAQAAELSRKWGREVTVGGVATQLVPRLGVVVKDVSVGPGQGEPEPLATLQRAEVQVPLMVALRSRGKDIQVEKAEVTGLTVNVIKLPDGSQNVSRLLDKISEGKEPAKPEEPSKPADLSDVRVDLAAVENARIRFIDLGGEKRRELEVNQLNVKVRDLRAGQPLVVSVTAAVFAAAQNLEVELKAAPLPPTLVPTPEHLSIKAKAIDLGPLGPFVGKDVGLDRGTLDADWSADLGGAVPGGEGPTSLTGSLKVAGLHFQGAEGGKALDVSVRTDVKGDVAKGDLRIADLDLVVGPVVAHGKGAVQGLMSDAPRVEGLEVSIPKLDPGELAAYVPALRKSIGDQVSGPASLSIRASGTAASQAIDVTADLTAMKLNIPKQLSKAPGAPMKLAATVSGAKSALRFQADADMVGVDLRPGGDIDKAPGQPLTVSAKGTFARKAGATHVEVDALKVDIQQSKLSGTAKVDMAGSSTTAVAQLESPKLDLDKLLYTAPKPPPGAPPPPAPPAPPAKDPHRFDGLRVDANVKVGLLHVEDMDLQNVRLEATLVGDVLTIKRLNTGFYGGEVVGDGTSIQLGPAQRPFHATLKVKDVDMQAAIASQTDKKWLAGRFTGNVEVDGVGTKITALSQTLGGNVGGQINDGKLLGVDVLSAASGLLAKALPFAGQALQSGDLTELGKELPFSITIDHGVARLKRPISLTRPQGSISLDGGARLDGTLDLAGTLNLAPETVSKITKGKVVPKEPFPIPLKITGPAWKPSVSIVDLQTPVRALVKLAATEAAGKILGDKLGDKGKQVADIVKGGAEDKAKAEAAAREEAEKAKKRLEEAAKKKLQNLFGGH